MVETFSKLIPDYRHHLRTVHSMNKLLKQRVYMLIQGYEDTNDVFHLQNDPLFKDVPEGDLASQPTLSRFENGIEKRTVFELCYACIERYVSGFADRKEVIIDIDATDDPTHGTQQLAMFNGYYGQKHQHFFTFPYQAGSWEQEEMCHCKVESTGIGLNIRYIISNFEGQTAREIYTEFYVKRGDASENRIKEVKNMCFSLKISSILKQMTLTLRKF